MKTLACVIALAALNLAACGGSHDLKGQIQVVEQLGIGSDSRIGQSCTGTGGYDDLSAGTAVVVKDQAGKVLATGSLEPGKIVALETCEFTFGISNVPDADFYQIEVSHRGEVTFSRKDLEARGWKVSLSLG